MRVTYELYATVQDTVGEKRLDREATDGATVRDLLTDLDADHEGLSPLLFDAEGRIRPNIHVLLNGDPVRDMDGPETRLSDGDTLMIVPSVAGGR